MRLRTQGGFQGPGGEEQGLKGLFRKHGDCNEKSKLFLSGDGFNYKISVTVEKKPAHSQESTRKSTPTFGSAKGRIKIADDFDDTPEGFEPYMP